MKKSLSLTFFITIISSFSFFVSADESVAKIVAETFMGKRMVEIVSSEVISLSSERQKLKVIDLNDMANNVVAYNAITKDGRKCFVLMTQVDNITRVVGYGYNHHFNFDEMPVAMKEWFNDYSEELSQSNSDVARQITTQQVEPLLKTKWNQFEPYNNMCPTYDDHRTVAGCTAIALSQVLYHFKSDNTAPYKVEYLNEPTTTEISVDFSKGNYDWDNILTTYEGVEYNDTQANAVARLVYESGVACKAEYGFSSLWDYSVDNFSTSAPLPFEALQRYFNFNCNIYLRKYVPTQMWIEIINENLLNDKPVIYAGSGGSDSHAFVIDGVDSEGFFHVNWGWGGVADGYYDLTYLRIDDDNYYSGGQQMIADISPRTSSDETYAPRLAIAGCPTYSPTSNLRFDCITTNFRDIDYFKAYDVYFAFVITDDNNNVLAEDEYSEMAYPGNYVFSRYDDYSTYGGSIIAMIEENNIPDGTYRINVVSKREEDNNFILCSIPERLQPKIKVTNGQYEFVNTWSIDDGQTEVRNVYAASDAYAGSDFYLGFTLYDTTPFNSYGIFQGGLYFENCETSERYLIQNGFSNATSMPGVEQDVIYKVRPTKENGFSMTAGKYKFFIENTSTSYTVDDFYIDIEEKPSFPVLNYRRDNLKVFSSNYSQNSFTKFLTSDIYSANIVGGKVRVNIYATPIDGGEESLIFSIPDVEINANSGCPQMIIDLPNNFYPLCGQYYFTLRYMTPEGERDLLNPQLKPQQIVIFENIDNIHPLIAESQELKNDYSVELGKPQTIMIEISNNHISEFEGYVEALFMDRKTGNCVVGKSELVSIELGETKQIGVNVTFESDGDYDVYLLSSPEGSHNSTYINYVTPISDSNGKRSVSSISLNYASIDSNSIGRTGLEIIAIYDLQGNKINDLSSGVNIVLYSDGSARKIIIK